MASDSDFHRRSTKQRVNDYPNPFLVDALHTTDGPCLSHADKIGFVLPPDAGDHGFYAWQPVPVLSDDCIAVLGLLGHHSERGEPSTAPRKDASAASFISPVIIS